MTTKFTINVETQGAVLIGSSAGLGITVNFFRQPQHKNKMTQQEHKALEAARHELVTLHGLLAADGAAPDKTWRIDTAPIVTQLDAVLNQPCETSIQPS